jgi:hypothetical protein
VIEVDAGTANRMIAAGQAAPVETAATEPPATAMLKQPTIRRQAK